MIKAYPAYWIVENVAYGWHPHRMVLQTLSLQKESQEWHVYKGICIYTIVRVLQRYVYICVGARQGFLIFHTLGAYGARRGVCVQVLWA
jgi:hypothetical protein